KLRWRALRPAARLIILTTVGLNLLGFLGLWLLESNNPITLGALSWPDQARAAWMQSVSLRTAGFAAFDFKAVDDSSALLAAVLMFIGGGSMSSAGGITVGTFVVIMAAGIAYTSQRKEGVLFGSTVSTETVPIALAVVVV